MTFGDIGVIFVGAVPGPLDCDDGRTISSVIPSTKDPAAVRSNVADTCNATVTDSGKIGFVSGFFFCGDDSSWRSGSVIILKDDTPLSLGLLSLFWLTSLDNTDSGKGCSEMLSMFSCDSSAAVLVNVGVVVFGVVMAAVMSFFHKAGTPQALMTAA